MEIDVRLDYVLHLSKEEFLLIGRALRGTLKPQEVEAARELQVAIVASRHKQLEQKLRESAKLMENIEKGGEE